LHSVYHSIEARSDVHVWIWTGRGKDHEESKMLKGKNRGKLAAEHMEKRNGICIL
jgi:hypothetical protein